MKFPFEISFLADVNQKARGFNGKFIKEKFNNLMECL